MTKIPFALQLHSIRVECAADLPAALEAVAKMGYQGVEFAGYFGFEAADLHHILDDLGLQAVGTSTWFQHVPLAGPGAEPHVCEAISYSRALGNDLLIGIGDVPFAQDRQDLVSGWAARAEQHNALARRLAPEGLSVGYHNHALEFEKVVEGERVWDILLAHLSRDVLIELDTGSAFRGGGDVLSILQSCPGRVKTVHLKPHSRTGGTRPLIGDDDLPWTEILELCRTTAGTEWYIVEYESDGYPRMLAVRRCLDTLKTLTA
jgi:sugar phosphate isomerase/epimerase